MNKYVLYHNPRCSKSRTALELLQDKGIEPTIVHYLETPPNKQTLSNLLKALNISAHELLRTGEEEYKTLALDNDTLTEDELIDAMVKHPKLIERPILVVGNRAVIGRPPEKVLTLLT